MTTSESSEAIRQTSETPDDEMVRAAWRHAGTALCKEGAVRFRAASWREGNTPKRNSLSGKHDLPSRPARGGDWPAHIGEALPAYLAAGNPEGSPSDPVTTDPKGEVGSPAAEPQIYAAHNTPALALSQGRLRSSPDAGSLVCDRPSGGRRMLLRLLHSPSETEARTRVRPSFALSLNERDRELLVALQAFFGCGWIRESRGDRTFKYEARSVAELTDSILPHFGRYPLRGSKATSFAGFSRVCRMIEQGDHLRRDGLREIVRIAYDMNLGKRRFAREELLRALGEVKG